MKRVLASLIDAATVIIPSLVILKSTVLSYAITTRNVNGEWAKSAAEQAELNDLPLRSLARIQEVGDTMYVFGGYKFLAGLLLMILLAALVYILVPATLGSSLGKRLTNLQVVDSAGEPPSVMQYMTRTLVGIIDLPLIGLIVATLDTHHRRLGDRMANTAVVDGSNVSFVDADYWQQQQDALKRSAERSSNTDLESMVAIDSRLDPTAAAPPPADPPVAETVEVPASMKAATPIVIPQPDSSPVDATPGAPVPEAPASSYVTESGFEVPEYATTPPEDRLPVAPESQDFAPDFVPVPTVDPTSTRIDEPAWDQPTGAPAPVWSPDHVSDLPPVEEPIEIDAPEAATPETATPELVAAAPSPSADALVTSGSIESPIWDDGWSSWMFFDPNQGRWLRHDTVTNQWIVAE